MIFSEVDIGKENILFELKSFDQNENNKNLSDICLKESKRRGKNLLNLEEICDFIIKNNINFDYLINEIAYINGVAVDNIGFSVYPITLYENELIYDLVLELQEEGNDIFIEHNPRSDISYAFDIILEECIKYDSIEPLEYIDKLYFNEGGASEVLGRSFGYMGPSIKHFASNQLDDRVLGKVFDSKRTYKGVDEKTGQIVDKQRTERNGQIRKVFGHGIIGDFASDVVANSFRQGISDYGVEKAQALFHNVMSGRKNPNEAINKIDSSINNLNHQAQANPKKRSLFRMIIDKLVSIKNKILAWLRGHRN